VLEYNLADKYGSEVCTVCAGVRGVCQQLNPANSHP